LPLATEISRGGTALDELRVLVRLSVPIAAAQFGLIAMSLVDTAVVGRLSVVDLAGAGIGRSIGFAPFMVPLGVGTALEPIAAQALGAQDPTRAWRGFLSTLRATLLLWLPAVLAAFATTLALPPLGVAPEVVTRARWYLLGQTPGFAFAIAFQVSKTFLQAHGRTAPALRGSVVANAVNLLVCNLLVRGDDALASVGLPRAGLPALGAFGAGLAFTVASFVLVAFVAVPAVRYRDDSPATPSPSHRVPLGAVYRIGLPVGFQMLAEVGVFSFAALLTGALGPAVASAHQIGLGMASFTFMAALGVSGATAVRVGHAIGAGRSPRRAGMLGMALGATAMSFGAAAFWILPGLLVRAFTTDAQTEAIGIDLLRIAAVFQLFDGVQAVAAGALRGAGDVRFPFVTNVVAHWLVGFPLSLLLGFGLGQGAPGIWWGLTAGLVTVAVVLAARFARLSRRTIAPV
jgi:MATE family multidrug resistance protein